MMAQKPGDDKDPPPAPVEAAPVIKTTRAGYETFVGTLQAVRKTVVGTAVDGRVVEVLVNEGDPIGFQSAPDDPTQRIGQPLVQLRTGTLDIELAAAGLKLLAAEQTLEELLTRMPTDLELAESKASETESMLAYSKAEFDRVNDLRNSVSTLEFEEARLRFRVNQQLATAAEIALRQFQATRQIREAQARSQVDIARQEVKRLEDLYKKYTIRAPFDGFVIQKMTEVGSWVNQGQPIIEVIQLDPIEMVIDVPQSSIGRLQKSLENGSDQVQIQLEGVPETITGTIDRIIPQADLKLRSFPVRIRIANRPLGQSFLLQPGMLGRASMAIGREQEMLMVKKDAVEFGDDDVVTLVVDLEGDDKMVRKIKVRTGRQIEDWIQVTGPLSEEDLVVTKGNERIRSGQKIKILKTDTDSLPEGLKSNSTEPAE